MAQRRIRLNLSGGAAGSGGSIKAGTLKGLRVRKLKKGVKPAETQAEADAPELEEMDTHVHGKRTVAAKAGSSMPRPLAEEKKAGGVRRVALKHLKRP